MVMTIAGRRVKSSILGDMSEQASLVVNVLAVVTAVLSCAVGAIRIHKAAVQGPLTSWEVFQVVLAVCVLAVAALVITLFWKQQ
jgi:hypothetical protein